MTAAWSPEPASNESMKDFCRAVFAETTLTDLFAAETDERELQKDMFRTKASIQERLRRIGALLSEPSLIEWTSKLEELSGQGQQGLTFLSLFDGSRQTIRDTMRAVGVGDFYVFYERVSGFVHGSTLDHLSSYGSTYFPNIIELSPEGFERNAVGVANLCDCVVVWLDLLKKYAWAGA
jgi:hypothetical protein